VGGSGPLWEAVCLSYEAVCPSWEAVCPSTTSKKSKMAKKMFKIEFRTKKYFVK
jgi:hypothetical protein